MYVVTGGAGFIGSNVVRGLNRVGVDDVLIVDDLSDGRKHRNLDGARFADYVDKDVFAARLGAFGKLNAVLHQGACAVTTERDGRMMMATNYEYSKAMLAYCAANDVPLVYASSAAVYGAGKAFAEDEANENALNVYAFSKLAFDNYVRRHVDGIASRVVGLRYFNVYGPGEDHKGDMASVALKMFWQHRRGEALMLFEGSDAIRRDFIHVEDVVAANLHFLAKGPSGIFNCGTGVARSFADLGQAVIANLQGARITHKAMPPELARQYQYYTCADLTRLRAAGFTRPTTTLEDGIADYMHKLKAANP